LQWLAPLVGVAEDRVDSRVDLLGCEIARPFYVLLDLVYPRLQLLNATEQFFPGGLGRWRLPEGGAGGESEAGRCDEKQSRHSRRHFAAQAKPP
jgi:hypothetical protein